MTHSKPSAEVLQTSYLCQSHKRTHSGAGPCEQQRSELQLHGGQDYGYWDRAHFSPKGRETTFKTILILEAGPKEGHSQHNMNLHNPGLGANVIFSFPQPWPQALWSFSWDSAQMTGVIQAITPDTKTHRRPGHHVHLLSPTSSFKKAFSVPCPLNKIPYKDVHPEY